MSAYTGGKGGPGVYQSIINQMPPHRVYIEAFLGAGSVLRAKRPAVATIGIERDAAVLLEHWKGTEVPNLTLLHANAIEWLAGHQWQGGELVYLDPPYLMETRRDQRGYYAHELSDADHAELLGVVKSLPCYVLISGYWSELYARELKDWRYTCFTTGTRGGGRATEWLWMNFPEPVELHDYRYLGRNFRERERIARQRRRWAARLARMSALQRQALLWAMQDAAGGLGSRLAVSGGVVEREGAALPVL
ncbi:MAG: DNA adenine methylase [Anaerolineales bacterium]|nr:DNA adenine methylase [Anaerolineales bacterium]